MKIPAIVLALIMAGACCYAQESRGTILGRVTDSSDAVIIGATVRAVSLATNTGGTGVTNAQGNYEIPYLQPGAYRLTVDMAGFRKAVQDNVQVNVDDRLVLDFRLQVGDVSQSVVVTADTPLVEASSPSVGTVINEQMITDLPVAGGNAFYLARLATGVAATGGHSPGNPFDLGHASSTIIVNGTRTGSSEVSLDGASNMSGTGASFSPPQDLVQEFKIQTLAFDASLGHGTGAIVNVSIKSGTNVLHGSTYFFDSGIRANPWFYNHYLYDPATGPVTPEKKRLAGNEGWLHQRWGDTLGGPLSIPRLYDGRNRTFWVFGYEGMYVRRQPTTTLTVPTLKEREGDFSDLLALGAKYQIYDPYTIRDAGNGQFTRSLLAGNIIPPNRIDPAAKKIMEYYPKPNTNGTVDGRNNYFRIYDENKDYRSFLGRIDHAFSENHRVFLRLNQSFYKRKLQTMPTIALGDIEPRAVWGVVLDDVYVINPRTLVNVRYGVTYQNPTVSRYSQGFDLTSLGFPQSLVDEIRLKDNPEGIAFPVITPDNYAKLGADGGSTQTTNYQTFAGTLTRLMGNHSVRAGGEFRLLRENGYNFGNVAPSLDFSTQWTKGPNQNSAASPIGQGLASLLFGLPTGGGIDINASRAEQSTFTAFYIQDDWKLGRRLTVNMGVRYEYEGPTTERFNRSLRGFDYTVPNPIQEQARANYAKAPIPEIPVENFRTMGGLTFPGINGRPRALWNADKNNFAPRIGLAYRVGRRTVARTGYGIFYGLMGIDRQDVNQGGFNQTVPEVTSLNNGLNFRATLSNPFPDGLQPPTGAGAGLLTQLGKGASYFYGNPLNAYMQRWTFSVQRELPQRIALDVTYIGNRGAKLNVNRQMDPIPREYLSTSTVRDQPAIDFLGAQVTNPFAGIPEFFGTTLNSNRIARSQLLKPYPQFTGITVNVPVGYSYYHSLQVLAQKRFYRGTSFQFGYTWSKFMEATSFLNATDLRPEKVVSDQDHPQRVIIGAIGELPFGKGKRIFRNAGRFLNGIIGGWQVQGWYEGQSGQALGFGNTILYGNLHDIPLPVSERKIERWFNTDASFEKASNKQPSNNIRTLSTRFNNVRGDGINNLDLSLFKTFRITEKLKAQFRSEAYNALNHAQFKNPNATPSNSAFGTVTEEQGHGQRQLTFAIKLLF